MPIYNRRAARVWARRAAWRWMVLLVIAVCAAWMIIHFDGNQRVAAAGQAPPSTTSQSGTPVVEKGDVEKLVSRSQDAQRLVDKPVRLHDVAVLTVTPEKNFWAGFGGDDSIFVVQPHGKMLARPAKVQHGDRVSITGTVRLAPQDPQQEQSWGVKDADIQRLNREKIYVEAKSVKKG